MVLRYVPFWMPLLLAAVLVAGCESDQTEPLQPEAPILRTQHWNACVDHHPPEWCQRWLAQARRLSNSSNADCAAFGEEMLLADNQDRILKWDQDYFQTPDGPVFVGNDDCFTQTFMDELVPALYYCTERAYNDNDEGLRNLVGHEVSHYMKNSHEDYVNQAPGSGSHWGNFCAGAS